MPPKGSGTLREEVKRRTWIVVKSAAKHLQYPEHKKAVERVEGARKQAEELRRERQAGSAASGLRNSIFAAPVNIQGPIAAAVQERSLAEVEMWEAYETHGASFDARDGATDTHMHLKWLRREAEVFGLMNPEATAKKLGFGDENVWNDIMGEDAEMQMFLLDTLDNLPRLRVLKEAQCKDVPSFDHLRKIQKQIQSDSGVLSIPCKSPLGSDWANPSTCRLIHVYPEIPEDGWRKNMDLSVLSPMYDAGSSHYYVNEISRLKNGDYVVPIRWLRFRGKVYVDAFAVKLNEQNEAIIVDKKTTLICAADLANNYLDLQDRNQHGGLFGDNNAYMMHCNLPRKLLQQEFHVHFVLTSPNASISEQYQEFKTVIESTHADPVPVEDESGDTTCFCLYMNSGPSNNPMQSEVSGHIGGKGNWFCRKCNVGGMQKEKATNEEPRTKDEIVAELEKQVKLACSGVMKPIQTSQTQTGIKDAYTQHWIDHLLSRFKEIKTSEPQCSNQDIEEELIQWTVDHRDEIYSAFLMTDDGLSIHAICANYTMQYAGSLIGRQFKTLSQTNIFHVHSLITDHQFMAWKAVGELAALLWIPEIKNIDEYKCDLKVAMANVLDVFSLIDPSKMITKIKLHLLMHIDDDAIEFGPLVGVATEIFESFNAIFRYCSILSNHLAPSHDIALQLGDQEGLKHCLTSGRWFCRAEEGWWRAGPGIRHFMADHPVLQRLLGWSEQKSLKQGEVKLEALKSREKKRPVISLKSTTAAKAVNYGLHPLESTWNRCSSVVGEQLDKSFSGSWIFAQSATDTNSTICRHITDILTSNNTVIVVLEVFQVLSVHDNLYGMPVLVRRDGETLFTILPAKNIKFKVNVQHDCRTAGCEATGKCPQIQEQVKSGKTESYIVHQPLDRFTINSHAFHNAHLLRTTLPRDLLTLRPLFEN
ncbi:hypothetical protein DFH07DRAFT_865022 [Mycena maculata]|uniref:Uncharacterized protein n=1 Tax=Mycena maculata TaxID=230809 RepID=A0AAD7KAZ6_9AGAR|nr:hypothetical protein DFH07DRAFT_865022 [Mycena maculata]